ncbi:right-handed parallel beta-helix repeat-containing protein [Halosolutus halophilus]|uniref:right-handed parallel beta-helix repeat-containing protein n=1 Tax=Halosolutus halophilus TaxID=1552990 RepID=UPI002234EE08|nr:right-handed parallel beta-helix repeat-containing protein [Halosolutus halophilus]
MVNRKPSDGDTDKNQLFDRRAYLKGIATSAVIPIAASSTAVGADSSDDYDEIIVSPNETYTKRLKDGETWGNVVIDITATGAKFRIYAMGDDWTVQNVGIRGIWDDPSKDEPFIASGNGQIENFYWADGTNWTARGGAATGIFVPAGHSGRIVMENLNLQDFGDNGVYAASPGNSNAHPAPGGGGKVIIRNSYVSHCTPTGFRLGTSGSYLENCVMYRNYRNYWAFYEHTDVIDCDLSNADGTGDISNRSGVGDIVLGDSSWEKSNRAEVTAKNSYWETEAAHGGASTSNIHGMPVDRTPRTKPSEVDGVPLSPEEAASGSATSSAPASDGPSESEDKTQENVLVFDGSNQGDDWEATDYRFAVEGGIEPSEHDGAAIDPELELDDGANSVDHTVANWKDAFTFDGDLLELEVDGPAIVYLNGEEIDPSEFGGKEDGSEESMPSHALVIDGTDASGLTSYSFSVSGEVVKANHRDASIDDGDVIDGQSVSGTVANWRDAYLFSGDITDFWLKGEADVTLEYEAQEQ